MGKRVAQVYEKTPVGHQLNDTFETLDIYMQHLKCIQRFLF